MWIDRIGTRVSEPARCRASFCTGLLLPEEQPGASKVVAAFHVFSDSSGVYEIDLIAPSSSPAKNCMASGEQITEDVNEKVGNYRSARL